MTPSPWFGFWRGLLFALWPGPVPRASAESLAPWHAVARRRRAMLLMLVMAMAISGVALRLEAAPAQPDAPWWAATVLMTLLFAWAGVGCATAAMGAWAAWHGDPFSPTGSIARTPIDAAARTAIVMPICNEDVSAVFAGLRATCESLAATGALQLFDVFVLSDTADPALRAAEERAWRRLCAMLGEPADGSGRLFYRWRKRRVKRKAGNVADFCRRWGRNYRYMVVLDADSTMSGDTLVQLVRLMEAHPRTGIMQTLPQVANPTTLHARAQRFASRVTGQLFARGMAWWQLGDSHYWGHNAILRVAPFMRHCALARLPGRGGLSGEILSHDFVEAALMGRMGYEVWLVPELGGSWEQSPANLIDELQRDRRWCQGNLQNLRLVAEPGWRSAHRAMFAVGALSYGVAPLWLGFTVLGLSGSGLSTDDRSLWLLTIALLLLPRVLSVGVVVARKEAAAFGGVSRLAGSALLELLFSSMQAPLRMLAHCVYVFGALTGLKLEWKSPPRAAEAPRWGDVTRRLGGIVLLPIATGLGLLQRSAAVALAPMWLPLSMAVPFVVLTGHPRAGGLAKRFGLLRTPEERMRPRPLVQAAQCRAFHDLKPTPAPRVPTLAHPTALRGRMRWAHAGLVLITVAVAAMSPRPSGFTPELPHGWREGRQIVGVSHNDSMPAAAPILDKPPSRKRVMRERPARMIDEGVRRRAMEAVKRALASESSPA
jgi:membrane glycosyltransferase